MKRVFNFNHLILLLAFIAIPAISFAQDNGNSGDNGHHQGGGNSGNGVGNGGGTSGGATAPLDGGISLLLAAGIGYSAKKITSRKKTNENI